MQMIQNLKRWKGTEWKLSLPPLFPNQPGFFPKGNSQYQFLMFPSWHRLWTYIQMYVFVLYVYACAYIHVPTHTYRKTLQLALRRNWNICSLQTYMTIQLPTVCCQPLGCASLIGGKRYLNVISMCIYQSWVSFHWYKSHLYFLLCFLSIFRSGFWSVFSFWEPYILGRIVLSYMSCKLIFPVLSCVFDFVFLTSLGYRVSNKWRQLT